MNMRCQIGVLIVSLSIIAVMKSADAHEVRSAYLQITEIGAQEYEIFWKTPLTTLTASPVSVRLPESCLAHSLSRPYGDTGVSIERWTVECNPDLVGQPVTIFGLSSTLLDVFVRVERLGQSVQYGRITSPSNSLIIDTTPSPLELLATYLILGVDHILTGLDHLALLLVLLMIVRNGRRLFLIITAFTVAHSFTLAMVALGITDFPRGPIEVLIVASVAIAAVELAKLSNGKPGLTYRRPWIVAFMFGLLHGAGFAAALLDFGLPARGQVLALFSFNVGVEIGQLSFILLMVLLGKITRQLFLRHWSQTWQSRAIAYSVGPYAVYLACGLLLQASAT